MTLDRRTKSEIKDVVEEQTKDLKEIGQTLAEALGTKKAQTTEIPKMPTPQKKSLVVDPGPRLPKPPTTLSRRRRHPMAIKGEIRFWISTIIEISAAAAGIAFIVSLLILIVKWGQWLWRII